MTNFYDESYARTYIERTLAAPYTIHKNKIIASTVKDFGISCVYDIGGNVSGLLKLDGSLRYQLERKGVSYNSLDLSFSYFDSNFALQLGQDPRVIYAENKGTVGDAQRIPFRSNSLDCIVCADVIEHIPNPKLAIQEIMRVLKPGGTALIVVPSLYKLDAIQLPHIIQKRFSTHENRLLVSDWLKLFEGVGMVLDRRHSRPLGIASGLIYMSWLNPKYVPARSSYNVDEECSEEAILFKRIKNLIGLFDEQIDNLVLGDKHHGLDYIRDKFKKGDIKAILNRVRRYYEQVSGGNNEELDNFVDNFDYSSVSLDGLDCLENVVKSANETLRDNAFFGNSALLVVQKS